ncbi:hypothetical protein ACMFMG_001933 [Clarireedia jacksonii]
MPIMKYWDGQGLRKEQKRSHTLRYVMKNRKTGEVLFVVLFTLYLKEDVDEDGTLKEGVVGGKPFHMLPEGEKEKHLKERNGDGEEGEGEGEGEEKKEEKKEEEIKTNDDDDVD